MNGRWIHYLQRGVCASFIQIVWPYQQTLHLQLVCISCVLNCCIEMLPICHWIQIIHCTNILHLNVSWHYYKHLFNNLSILYSYKFLRDVYFAVFADNLWSMKIKSLKIYNSIDTVLCQNPVILENKIAKMLN